jgi:hypothetical protein
MGKTKKTAPFLAAAVLGALFLPVSAFAQTAEKLDAVLDAEQVSFVQAAAIVLPAAGLLPPEAGDDEAFAYARDWFPRRAERDIPIKMGELSHLVMRSFGLSGGLLYALFPGPRYAYRALAWRRLLPFNPDPARTVSGEELLHITGLALSLAGDAEPLDEAPAEVPVSVEVSAPAEVPEPETNEETGMTVEQGTGLSSGSEGVLPYKGEFEVE